MSATTETTQPARWKSLAFTTLKIVFALAFIAFGALKLSGAGGTVTEFTLIGFGQWFRYFTAFTEISAAILLLLPSATGFGALLMAGVSIGAFFAQWRVLHQDVIHPIVLTAAALGIAWSSRVQILARVGLGMRYTKSRRG